MVGPPERLELGTVVCVILCVFGERKKTLFNRNILLYKTRSASDISLLCFSKCKDLIPQTAKKSSATHFSQLPPLALPESWDWGSPGDMEEIPGSQSMVGSLLQPQSTDWIPVATSPRPSLLKDFC